MACLGYDFNRVTRSCTVYYGLDRRKLNHRRKLSGMMPMERVCVRPNFFHGCRLCTVIGMLNFHLIRLKLLHLFCHSQYLFQYSVDKAKLTEESSCKASCKSWRCRGYKFDGQTCMRYYKRNLFGRCSHGKASIYF